MKPHSQQPALFAELQVVPTPQATLFAPAQMHAPELQNGPPPPPFAGHPIPIAAAQAHCPEANEPVPHARVPASPQDALHAPQFDESVAMLVQPVGAQQSGEAPPATQVALEPQTHLSVSPPGPAFCPQTLATLCPLPAPCTCSRHKSALAAFESHAQTPTPALCPCTQLSPPFDGSHVFPAVPQFCAPAPASLDGKPCAMHAPLMCPASTVSHSELSGDAAPHMLLSLSTMPLLGTQPHAPE